MSRPALPWRTAWERSAFGRPDGIEGGARSGTGFYAQGSGAPGRHFATSANEGPAMAEAVIALLKEVDDDLGRPPQLSLVDVGSGSGELVEQVLAGLVSASATSRGWHERLRLVGVDVRPRPAGLHPRIEWVEGRAPEAVPPGVVGLLWLHELLDDVPCDVVQVDDVGGARLVMVADDGAESLGPLLAADDPGTVWLTRWWPLDAARPGDRAEVGLERDALWRACADRLTAGALIAVDYAHRRADREAGRWAHGTLLGYRDGTACPPVPDGSCNLTAHVALDACAAATDVRPGDRIVLTTQREALVPLAPTGDPQDVHALASASRWATLRDPAGAGAFGWLALRR